MTKSQLNNSTHAFIGDKRRAILCTLRIVIAAVVLGNLTSCQTPIDNSSQQHKLVADKWKALAKYASSTFSDYGLTITAKLSPLDQQSGKARSLISIQLSRSDSFDNINLLAPEFLRKYACNFNCQRLSRYIPAPLLSGNTPLINYFSQYEFKLFKFYGQLMLLNEKMEVVNQRDHLLWQELLDAVIKENRSFDSLEKFTEYLYGLVAMSSADMRYFVDNWEQQHLEQNLAKLFQSPQEKWGERELSPSEIWSDEPEWSGDFELDEGVDIISITNNDGVTFDELPNLAWLAEDEQPQQQWREALVMPWVLYEQYQNGGVIPTPTRLQSNDGPTVIASALAANRLGLNEPSAWQTPESSMMVLGDTVCSYNTNIFGTVSSVTDNEVVIDVRGQAKMVDAYGSIHDVPAGILFNLSMEFMFMPLDSQATYKRANVAKCHIDLQ